MTCNGGVRKKYFGIVANVVNKFCVKLLFARGFLFQNHVKLVNPNLFFVVLFGLLSASNKLVRSVSTTRLKCAARYRWCLDVENVITVEVLARTIQGLLLLLASIWPCQFHLVLMPAVLLNVTISGWGPEWCNNRCAIASITSLPLWGRTRLFNSRQRAFTAVGVHECGTGHHNRAERKFVGG